MKFDLRKPCSDCPFRSDKSFPLDPGRVESIYESIVDHQGVFSCHKTIDYSEFDDETDFSEARIPEETEQHCAGAMIFLESIDRPNQMMRIFERFGEYDRTKLSKKVPVYKSLEEMIEGCDIRNIKRSKKHD